VVMCSGWVFCFWFFFLVLCWVFIGSVGGAVWFFSLYFGFAGVVVGSCFLVVFYVSFDGGGLVG